MPTDDPSKVKNTIAEKIEELSNRLKNLNNESFWLSFLESLNLSRVYYKGLDYLCRKIDDQIFKFYNAPPGVLVKLTANLTPGSDLTPFVCQDLEGNYLLILKKISEGKFYSLGNTGFSPWDFMLPLNYHLLHLLIAFDNNRLPHLKNYIENMHPYILAVRAIRQELSNLPVYHRLRIPADGKKLKKPLRIIKTKENDFIILLETGSPEVPFLQLNSEKEIIWQEYDGIILERQAVTFLQNLSLRRKTVMDYGVPNPLKKFVSHRCLVDIYNYLLDPRYLARFADGREFRIDKYFTRTRTLNILRQPNGEYVLILETNSKLANFSGPKQQPVGRGKTCLVNPAWRIDIEPPREWIKKII